MIVRCHSIYNENTDVYINDSSDGFITKGKEYVVLEIDFSYDRVYYRIIPDDNGHPVLIRSDDFEIVSGKVPKNWILHRFNNELSSLAPKKWIDDELWDDSFWEDWDNGNPKALKCFEEEYKIILETDAVYLK